MDGAGSKDISGVMPSQSKGLQTESDAASEPQELFNGRLTDFTALGNAFNVDLGQSSVKPTAEEHSGMMKSVAEIFELEEEVSGQEEEMDDDDEESVVDLEDQMRRTQRLKSVLRMLAQLWWSGSDDMDLVAEMLADGSRNREFIYLSVVVVVVVVVE